MMAVGAAVIRHRYDAEAAEKYDALRAETDKFKAEDVAVESWLGMIGRGARVLDIPVGTGRFLAAYRRNGMTAVGMDVSPHMLAKARIKCDRAELRFGDILAIDMSDATVDVAIAVRLLNFFDLGEMRTALLELSRVTLRWIITSGGRSNERNAMIRDWPGFMVFDEKLIDHNGKHGDYPLMLLRRN